MVALAVLAMASLSGGGGAAASTAEVSAWPEALHDGAHSATASVTGPSTGRVEWTRALGGNITPGPVVAADGTIYVATNAGVLHALNPATGADLWTFNGGSPYTGETDLSTSPLVLPQGSILWPGPAGTLYELSSGGQVLWSHRFGAMVLSPVLAGTDVFVGLMSGTVWELNVSESVPVLGWSTSIGHTSFGSPVVSPDGDVITTADKSIVALVGATGVVRWRHTASSTIEVSPSVAANGDVYVTANDGSAYGLRPDGSLAWRRHIGHESYSSSSVSSTGLLYFGDNGGALNIVRAASGDVVRIDRGTHGLWAAQAVDDRGDVYFGTQGKEIYGYNAAGHRLFHVRATAAFDSYPALSAGGTLLIGDEAGLLYAIG